MIEHRVYGPPGTGKTRYLTGAVEEAANNYGPGAVMVSSYTTTAAAEVASRAPGLPEDNVGTLHKACFQAIGRLPVVEEKKKAIQEWNEFCPAYAMSFHGGRDINSGLEYGDSTLVGDAMLSLTTILRNRLIPFEHWPQKAKEFFEIWKHWKLSIGSIDYTDMLEIALKDTYSAPGDPQIMFVDEAQDCTALQFAVLKHWAKNCEKLVMVGDDDQCIYQFAGATPEAFASEQIGPNDKLLDQSYRVPITVWEHAMDWISKIPGRVEKDYMPTSEPGFVRRCPFTYKQGSSIAKLIYQCLERYENVMVIAACSYMVEPTKAALYEEGIPFHNPYRYVRADWNPLKLGSGTTFAQKMSAFMAPELYERWWTVKEFKDFGSVLKAKGVFQNGKKKILENGEFDSITVELVFDLFEENAAKAILNNDRQWFLDNLINDEARKKAIFPQRIIERFGLQFIDANIIPPSVVLGTIHSVKGGEADVVILIPDLSQISMQEWTGKGKDAIRRLMYVGLTRAKQGVFILRPNSSYTCNI